jgi:hypothetical protein
VQLQALKWDATDRPDDMLLRGRELADGLRWAADPENTPTATESSFLATSRAKRTRARLKVATPVLVAFLLIVVVASYNALKQRAKIQQLEGERVVMDLKKTNQALEVAEASLERTKEERDDATGRARNLQSTVDGLTTRLAQTTDRLTQTQAALDSQTAKRATERERIVSAVAKARRDVGSPLRHPLAIGDPERTVRWVILHHTKVPTGAQYRSYGGVATLRGIYAYRLFQDNSVRLPYHYLVAPDGAIWPALDIKTPIEDVPKWAEAVHVGLVLDGDQGRAYTKQREATGELLRALLTRVVRRDPTPDPEGIVKLCGGCEWGGTHCPGERIRLSEVLKWIPKLRSTEPREQPAD